MGCSLAIVLSVSGVVDGVGWRVVEFWSLGDGKGRGFHEEIRDRGSIGRLGAVEFRPNFLCGGAFAC